MASAPAPAGIILAPGVYRLNNRNSNPLGAGLGHLNPEQLFRLSRVRDVLAFSFDHPSSDVTLDLKQTGASSYALHIFGTAWGSYIKKNGSTPLLSAPARLDLSYDLVRESEGDNVVYLKQTSLDQGTIWFHGMPVRFRDFAAARRFAFRIDDDQNGSAQTLSGSALLTNLTPPAGPGGWTFTGQGDWSFSVRPNAVPGPGPAAVLGAAALLGRRRRRA